MPCSATGTLPIYIALIWNLTVVMNTTNIASSKLYQEGNYTCVATNKYGTDVKHFVVKGGEKMSIISKNRSGDFTAYWVIWSTSGRLLDNHTLDEHEKKKRRAK